MFKALARWILRDEIAASKKQVGEQASHITSLSNEVLRLTRIVNARDAWWRITELLTSPEAVSAIKAMTQDRWDQALALMTREPHAPDLPERRLVELIHHALRTTITGLLEGMAVTFNFQINPESMGKVARASVYIDRANFHAATVVERQRPEDRRR